MPTVILIRGVKKQAENIIKNTQFTWGEQNLLVIGRGVINEPPPDRRWAGPGFYDKVVLVELEMDIFVARPQRIC